MPLLADPGAEPFRPPHVSLFILDRCPRLAHENSQTPLPYSSTPAPSLMCDACVAFGLCHCMLCHCSKGPLRAPRPTPGIILQDTQSTKCCVSKASLSLLSSSLQSPSLSTKELRSLSPQLRVSLEHLVSRECCSCPCTPHLHPVCPPPQGVVSRKDWDLCLRCWAGHPTPAICFILAPLRLSLQPAPLFQPNVLTYMSFHKHAHSHQTGPDADVFSPLRRPLGSPSTTTKVLHPTLLPNPCF